jgi:hypothetical protein
MPNASLIHEILSKLEMPMNVSEMAAASNATVAMALYGSGASPGRGDGVIVGAAVDVKAAYAEGGSHTRPSLPS